MIKHFFQHASVRGNNAFKHALRRARKAVLLAQRFGAQHAGAHHWRQRQRHHGGDQNRYRQRHRKFAEQPTHNIAHKQQRDQHRNQREGQGDNGKADFARALERGCQRLFAFFDIARDIFDDHDGVIDHKSGGDGQRHQRQVIDREIEEHHYREGADQRQRHGDGGNNRRRDVAQEHIDNHDHQRYRQHQLKLRVADGCANIGGAIGKHVYVYRFWQAFNQLRQHCTDAVGGVDDIRARLALNVHHDRLLFVGPRAEPAVFCPLLNGGDIAQANRRTVLVSHNQLAIFIGGLHLIVRRERDRTGWAIQRAFRRVDVGAGDRRADGFAGQS
ncbi:hypothetical protein D3C80_588810 [compost metagenome]